MLFAIILVSCREIKNGDLTQNNEQRLYKKHCANCHGKKGEGNVRLKSPSLAGMPLWYTKFQISAFKEGRRGEHKKDRAGIMMRNSILKLEDKTLEEIMLHIQKMPVVKRVSTVKGNIVRGKEEFKAHCITCHRYNASGERVFKSAPLVYLQDWYLKEQIMKFKNGLRGYHNDDVSGKKMTEVLSTFEDQKVLDDIVAYIFRIKNKDTK